MSAQNTNEEMNTTKALDDSMSNNNLNESMTVVGIEMQSTLEVNESESTKASTTNVLNECDSIQNLRPSTSCSTATAVSSQPTSMDSIDNSGDEGIGDLMDDGDYSPNLSSNTEDITLEDGFKMIELQPRIKVAVADEILIPSDLIDLQSDNIEEENDADTLSPLVIDNHVCIEHCEMMKHGNREIPGMYANFDEDYAEEEDEDDDEEERDEIMAKQTSSTATPPVFMKCPTTKDSYSSTDSDISYSYESKKSVNDNHNEQTHQLDPNSMSDDNKDSGCDGINKNGSDDDQPIEIPDDDFCEKIVEQVEFYFSNESLLKDAFLLKHVRRNKEGYVSLKLVSSFKRVRALTKDWRVVGIAIKRKSKKIELNDIETKIRRVDPLPMHDETMPSRTVVATNLPCEKLTVEKVYEIFAKCGEIALVRILRPNCSIPADIRQFVNKHPELQQNDCALIEFNESSSARKAQNMNGIVVFELVLPKKKTGKKATNMTKMIENFKYNSESENERTRGGENIVNSNNFNNRFYLKRNNSSSHFQQRSDIYQCSPSPRKMSLGNESNVYVPPMFNNYEQQQQQQHIPTQQIYEIPARRLSNGCIQIQSDRKYSNCSDGYSSCSDALSRRPSMCSDVQRRLSNFSDIHAANSPSSSRRSSLGGCVDFCSCGSRRMSQYSNVSDTYRRVSNGSITDFPRKFSTSSTGSRKYSTGSSIAQTDSRRISFDRRNSNASINLERKYSNGFDPLRKLSQTSDYYINGRKISTDSGYDRRLSINSITYDNENPITRSRNNSLIMCQNQISSEPLIRKPLGPDPEGSKGFASRTRKIGLIQDNSVVIAN